MPKIGFRRLKASWRRSSSAASRSGSAGAGFGVERLVPFFRVDVGVAAGQQNALRAGDEAGLLFLRRMQRDGDRDTAGLFDGSSILLPAALVVLGVVGGGFGNKYPWLWHIYILIF